MAELLVGCGARRIKELRIGDRADWSELVTLDINPAHKPDVVHDLNDIPLPFPAERFDEIHAYEVLEHVGAQGDYRFFFAQFADLWHMLRPNGLLCGSAPPPTSP
jgi:2-polyprenyl-3-methyl-5-hydroxy-6-metoxy-1,4-benzoquinol methylase